MSERKAPAGTALQLNQLWMVAPPPFQDAYKKKLLSTPSSEDVTVHMTKPADVDGVGGAFRLKDFYEHLQTRVFGKVLLYGPLVSSTQAVMRDSLPALPEGAVMVADRQTMGKGRGDNVWSSPEGCLLWSFKATLDKPALVPFLQYLVCLALVDAVKSIQDVKLRIKWPNDLYTEEGEKIGGILCQSSYSGKTFDIVIGVGLNVTNEAPTTCLTALSGAKPAVFTRENTLASFLTFFERYMGTFVQHGFQPFVKAYTDAWLHTGQVVQLKTKPGEVPQLVTIDGVHLETGYLLAHDTANPMLKFELHPDGHSLNWMDGLLVYKTYSTL